MYCVRLALKSAHRRDGGPQPRAGLAPLELVLSLPLLLVLMALIVNFAHAATWKIRSATSARLAMWRHRPMWDADFDPAPVNFWPKGASLAVGGAARIGQVDPIWNVSPIAQAWIKGPIFTAGAGRLVVRNNRVNEMAEGVSRGTANVSLLYPFMPSMGTMSMAASHTLLDSAWQYSSMGYGWNGARRAKGWWQLEDDAEWNSEKQVFLAADMRIVLNSQRELLRPLDRDQELIDFYGSRNANSDFYPHPSFCMNDPLEVRRLLSAPGGFLDRIRGSKDPRTPGVAERMARAYLQMYQTKLAQLAAQQPPPAGEIAQLELWIQQLLDFIAKL